MTRCSGICGKFASFTAATVSHSQPHAATCSHLQPLPDTHNHTQPLAATRSHSSGRKWPQVTAAVKWPQVAASGRFRQVAASGRKWPLFPISNSTPNATPLGMSFPRVHFQLSADRVWRFWVFLGMKHHRRKLSD